MTEYVGESFSLKGDVRVFDFLLSDIEKLQSVDESTIKDGVRVLVVSEDEVFFYSANAESAELNGYPPFNQVDGKGFWFPVDNKSRVSIDSFIKIEAFIVLEESNKAVIKFSNDENSSFKPMEVLNEYEFRLIVETEESAEFPPGDYILQINKYLIDTRFESGYKLERQMIKLFSLKDAVR